MGRSATWTRIARLAVTSLFLASTSACVRSGDRSPAAARTGDAGGTIHPAASHAPIASIAASTATPTDSSGHGRLVPGFRLTHPQLAECSGIVCQGGAYWAHNDSGDGPNLYRSATLDFAGAEVFEVPGAEAYDWEDIDQIDGDLLVFDTGDNRMRRTNPTIYRVRYTPRHDERGSELRGDVSLVAKYPIRYPDGPHDVEAGTVIDGRVYLVTKARHEPTTSVFRFDTLEDSRGKKPGFVNVPTKIAELAIGLGEEVTAATFDEPSGTLLLLTYSSILRYPKDAITGAPASRTRIWARQCEAMTICGGTLIIANEERDVFVIDGFIATSYSVLVPKPMRSLLPVTAGTFPLGRDAAAWKEHARDLVLKGAEPGEYAQWLLAGDRLLVRAGFKVDRAMEPSSVDPPKDGSLVVLMFAPLEAERFDGPGTVTYVAVGVGADFQPHVWRVDLAGEEPALIELPEAEVVGSADDRLEFELALPRKMLFGEETPVRFRFDLQAMRFHEGEDPYVCNKGLFAFYRPLAWAEVSVGP